MTNDEFIADCRKRLHGQLGASLTEALDRLEALIGQGKPTPGQIGLVDGDKLFAYLIAQAKMGMDERDQERTDALRDVAHILGRFSVSGQGREERDKQPELKHNDPLCGADIVCGTHSDSCHCKCHASADKAQGGMK